MRSKPSFKRSGDDVWVKIPRWRLSASTIPAGAKSPRRLESIWPPMYESYSAGTETVPQINQDAVRLIKQLYGIDMEQTQYSKLLNELPPVDIVITMGCNVACPYLPCKHREDWGLDDPTGKSDKAFLEIIQSIKEKIDNLRNRIEHNALL